MEYYRGKHCLITGGSSGIGFALAKKMARAGANVWILARDADKLDDAIKSIRAAAEGLNQRFGTLQADIQNEQQVYDVISAHISAEGAPDVLVNSAGVARPGYFGEIPIEQYRWMMDINFFGTVQVTKAVAPAMANRGSGMIVNIDSVAGFAALLADSAYSASKFALRGFSDSIRVELKSKGVRVVIVYPADTDTPQLAYENQFKPKELEELSKTAAVLSAEEVAEAIMKGVARGRSVITPGSDATMLFWLVNHVGNLLYPIMDYLVGRARKSVAKHQEEEGIKLTH
ncbi:MAG: SDR family oxidoreductase [Anaerolineaceae bacterium]|nr:SDR family oxidoreductase [Anaerolineaceae bacterium]